jgi:hypothetical protein
MLRDTSMQTTNVLLLIIVILLLVATIWGWNAV